MADPTAEEDESGAAPKDRLKDLLAQAKAAHKECTEQWADNRKRWLEDAEFRIPGEGKQWPSDIRAQREADGLPVIEADKLNQYVRQVVNDARQNRPSVKVRPVDDGGDEEVAEAYQGIVRHICVVSNADESFDTAVDHSAACGFGFFRVLTEYASEKTFNQDLVVRRVPNPLAVLIGRYELADGSDMKCAFFEDDIPKDEFERLYPQAKVTNWESEGYTEGWSSDKTVKVCEYWYRVEEAQTLHLLKDGTTVSEEDYQLKLENLEEGEEPPVIEETREIPTCKIKFCRMTGAEILEEKDWLGKYIPIIPVFGSELNIKGKTNYSGMIRPGKGPQQLHNYSRASFAQRVSLTTKAPWLAAAEQIAGYPEWNDPQSGKYQVLRYKAFDENGNPMPAPIRIQPSDIPAGYAQDAEMSEHDIQGALGMYNASLGERSNEKSGRAIMARQREGDTATFHYIDNLNRAIRLLGRILVDAIPKYYDSRRAIRILGEDGTSKAAEINPEQDDAVQRMGAKVIYNLNVGSYDVVTEAGPSYTTKRQESADAMLELSKNNPAVWQTHGDLIVRSQDWPNAEEWAKRTLITMPPPLRQAIEQEKQGDESDEVKALKQQAQQMLDQAHQQIQAAEQGIAQRDQALHELQSKLQGITDQQRAVAENVKVQLAEKDLSTQEQVYQATLRADEAELELKRQQAMSALEELQEQTVEQVKALLAPTPAVEQPAAVPPPGPSPELMAILDNLQRQSEAITQGFQMMARPRTGTLSDGRQIRIE